MKQLNKWFNSFSPPSSHVETSNGKNNHDYSITTPRPLYQQVKDYIVEQIKSNVWQPDTKIPSENELVEQLNVSRMTVHRALRELTTEGHLVRLQGVGTFIAQPKPQSALLEIRSIADEIRARGGVHSSQLHLLQQEVASPHLCAEMGLPSNAQVYHSIIVHRDSGKAIQLSDRYINPAIAPDYLKQDFTKITPAAYLLQIAPVSEAEHIIEAIMPDKQIQELLEIKASEPCLVLHRRTWVDDVVATKNRFVYPGSRHRIGGRFKPVSSAHPVIT